jgi:hypothetical protein
MRRVLSSGISTFTVLLAVVQLSSSKSGTPARIQNRDRVQRLYGSPISEVYRTSQNLTITASFAGNGSLCQADIESGADVGITDSQLNAVLDELAPEDVRGKHKLSTFLNITCLKRLKPETSTSEPSGKPAINLVVDPCRQCSGVSDDYERGNITKYGNTNEYGTVRITLDRVECKDLDKHR